MTPNDISFDPDASSRKKYPFNNLEVGQSFLVPFPYARQHNLRCIAQYHQRNSNKRFSVRVAESGVRVFRTE